ncbi:MAG: 1-acyl-sn-glycerol-3-phosphate acyltransferase [Oscillospiraceae bacterium]|nr:1-acyl-sn-glycerol-3-phosphate acyltransferase [Oscillospiraceae bacterium]
MQTKTKTKKWVLFRHKVITCLAYLVLYPWTKLKYHIDIQPAKELKKRQCVVLMNHQTAFDQFFVSIAAFPRPQYFVASEDLFNLGFLSKLLRWAVAPIPIKKQTTDIQAVKTCIKVAREGGSIALAPEGNRTFSGLPCHSNPAITGLVKKLGLPVVIFRIEGGYGIHPRWSDVCRKGKMKAYVSRIIEPEEFADLSKEELYDLLQKELFVDETQNGQEFHHKRLAEYLERAMYVCPWCGLAEFHSEGDIITCKSCSRQIRYLPNQRLQGIGCDFPFPYMAQWYRYQEDYVNRLDTHAHIENPLYQDTVMLSLVEPYKRKVVLEKSVRLALYGNRLQMGQRTLFFSDCSVITVLGKNKLNIYHADGLFQVKGDSRFNALKYMNIFYRHKNQMAGEGTFLGI